MRGCCIKFALFPPKQDPDWQRGKKAYMKISRCTFHHRCGRMGVKENAFKKNESNKKKSCCCRCCHAAVYVFFFSSCPPCSVFWGFFFCVCETKTSCLELWPGSSALHEKCIPTLFLRLLASDTRVISYPCHVSPRINYAAGTAEETILMHLNEASYVYHSARLWQA